MTWQSFFPPDERVMALPSWSRPRLLIPAGSARARWHTAAFYPAFRRRARLFRWLLRLAAASGSLPSRVSGGGQWSLHEFVRDHLPDVAHVAVLVGRQEAAKKLTARLYNDRLEEIGYLKVAADERAVVRLDAERRVLERLPEGVGPALLKHGNLDGMPALLTAPIRGRLMSAALPPAECVSGLVRKLEAASGHPGVAAEHHPCLTSLATSAPCDIRPMLDALGQRPWPVVIQHGDLAPWNVLQHENGKLTAVDWEQASPVGFPGFDMSYYVLQVAALVHRWSPRRSAAYAAEQVRRRGLHDREAKAIVRLSALDAFIRSENDGISPDQHLQTWRRDVWENR